MSQYRFTKSAKAILTHLVLKGQEFQHDLPGIVGCSYRTVIREVGVMREAGYIEHDVGLERDHDMGLERKRGKPRFVLRPTFFGVLEIFMWVDKDTKSIDDILHMYKTLAEIAEIHKDRWIVFAEWKFIDNNEDLLGLTLSAINEWMARNMLSNKSIWGGVLVRSKILPLCKHEIMAELLWGGDPIARTTDGLIFEPALLAYFKENPRLKEHMNEAIERQGELYKMRLAIIETWTEGKLMSKILDEWRRDLAKYYPDLSHPQYVRSSSAYKYALNSELEHLHHALDDPRYGARPPSS